MHRHGAPSVVWLGYGQGSAAEEEACDVEEDRGGEGERVHAVEDAAVPGDDGAKVLDTAIPLDRGHHQPTAEPGQGDDERLKAGLPEGKRSCPPDQRAQEGPRHNPANKAFDGLARTDKWGDLPVTEELAEDVLEHVAA